MAGAPGHSSAKETPVNCPSCGFANLRVARFCSGCGKQLRAIASAMPDAERRQVCVLFCDLVGSTPLSLRLDADTDWDEVQGLALEGYRKAALKRMLKALDGR